MKFGQLDVPPMNNCPRCGTAAMEVLRTHAYCVECNFSESFEPEPQIPDWVTQYFKRNSRSVVRKTGEIIEHRPIAIQVGMAANF